MDFEQRWIGNSLVPCLINVKIQRRSIGIDVVKNRVNVYMYDVSMLIILKTPHNKTGNVKISSTDAHSVAVRILHVKWKAQAF